MPARSAHVAAMRRWPLGVGSTSCAERALQRCELISDALAYLNQFINYERSQPQRYAPETLSLDRVNHLLDRLGRPDRAYRAIHIAGTKGKGSTAAMIESCLRAAGYRTGFYTSPHLHTFRERMRVNNEFIAREQFAQLVDEIEPHVERRSKA